MNTHHSRRRQWSLGKGELAGVVAALVVLAGCGSSAPTITGPQIAPARTYALASFHPAGAVVAGRPTTVSFAIRQPSGAVLTRYRACCDPHAGVDLIIVRGDDSHVQYDDSDISAAGMISQPVTFPTPGRYRIIVDAYPRQTAPNAPINFQLFTWVTVRGAYHPQPLPSYRPTTVVDGYRFQIQGRPHLRAIQANFLTIKVLDSAGHKAVFGTWHGALAHAIFIHVRSLAYIHTHVCSPGAIYCTSVLGAARVTGSSSAPGELKVGVLLPESGSWRMFLLTYIGGRHITAPFTLNAGA
ncbi:MAG TPA: hypothetical protein VG388_04215 [Solirubrobacteraceae bacterium]|jgi:hypothetical protein|nr:hypothetical protein [Solirubrobacteraceae bacterium]